MQQPLWKMSACMQQNKWDVQRLYSNGPWQAGFWYTRLSMICEKVVGPKPDQPDCLQCLLWPWSKSECLENSWESGAAWDAPPDAPADVPAAPLPIVSSTHMYSTPYWGAWIWSLLVAVPHKWMVPRLYPDHGYLWQPSCASCVDTYWQISPCSSSAHLEALLLLRHSFTFLWSGVASLGDLWSCCSWPGYVWCST